MVVVACRNIGLEFALNFILSRSSSNLAYSRLSVMVVKTFQRRIVRRPTQTIQPAIPDTVFVYILNLLSVPGVPRLCKH